MDEDEERVRKMDLKDLPYAPDAETMKEFNTSFKKKLNSLFPDGDDIFDKINDALKLQPFLAKRNAKRFKKFHKEFIVASNFATCVMDEFIMDIGKLWSTEEMIGWKYIEKVHFLEYAWNCKDFRRKMERRLQKELRCSPEDEE